MDIFKKCSFNIQVEAYSHRLFKIRVSMDILLVLFFGVSCILLRKKTKNFTPRYFIISISSVSALKKKLSLYFSTSSKATANVRIYVADLLRLICVTFFIMPLYFNDSLAR